ncbi:retrotransposon protein, putative, ty1-copia subclass [Tanacetum coccineum]|uniref:Retrotransposon protein, putative, ty1-copia subclass n=1 Tax=Tanacetum coccineum TaxID=301880 RepID=A0ABQ5H492_9ASTR
MARKPFPHQVERAKDLLGLIHTDVCGPFRTVSREGASYFITFTDDFYRYGFVYLMKHKHEVFETFKVFKNEVENQLGKKIKSIRSDRGGEYLSHEFVNHMKSCGIISQLTPPYTPQHNGVSERRNSTLLDMVQSMMNLTTLPKSFWGYDLETTARILNMFPTKKVDRTPYEIWHGKSPKLSYLRVWGCEALVKRDTLDKLDSRSIKCIFSRNVRVPIHRSVRIPQVPDRYGYYLDIEEYELGDLNEPPNYKAALANPEYDKWLEAMNTEMQSVDRNNAKKHLWHIITYGDFPPIQNNPETKKDEIVPLEKQSDDLKKRPAKNNEAKMVIYNALPRFLAKNLVRKFPMALHPKVCVSYGYYKEIEDLTSLSLDELIGNLKVYEVIIKKDFEMVKDKREQSRSLALKAKKYLVMKIARLPIVKTKNMPWPDPKYLIGECPMLLKSINQRDFVGGTWSDNSEDEEEKNNEETCLVAQASNEICLGINLEANEWIKDS